MLRRFTRRFATAIAFAALISSPVSAIEQVRLDAAIERGLQWVVANPVMSAEHDFLERVDEALFYVTIARQPAITGQTSVAAQALDNAISRLARSPELHQVSQTAHRTLIDHYHLLLATHLVETAQTPAGAREAIIDGAQHTLVNSPFENPTFRLTVGRLLELLGATPSVGMDALRDTSLINRVAPSDAAQRWGPPVPFTHPLAYYALVHEVAALTDFGRLAPDPWLVARRPRIGRILTAGVRLAMQSGHADLLAELLLCNHMLGLPPSASLRNGIAFLVENQLADGSWGEQPTPRADRKRHAVQTATAALLVFRATAPAP